LIKKKHFRADLFYRITGFTFELPPLRKRRDDIPSLAKHFLKICATEDAKPICTLSDVALRRLLSYDWPGNVRELAHVIQRSVIFSKDREIGKGDIELPKDARLNEILPYKTAVADALNIFDMDYITDILNRNNWNITQAARMADLDRSTF
jgi:DNA-binding NtrC family response regulator